MAASLIPGKMKRVNLFVSGLGLLGLVKNVKLPVVKTKKDVINGVHVDSGLLEPMEFECELTDFNRDMLKEAAKLSEAKLKVKGDYLENNTNAKFTATLGGSIDVEMDSLEDGKEFAQKVKMYVNVYNLNVNGDEIYDIDLVNVIAKIDGKDIYEATRSAVM
jgi:P2 family phage contractile tail tube protein